ncbi:CocE/NonD family hydrolase [Cryptosporangium arvum]|uniref:Putative hydrolase, CocE/NonD family n=1 Tax=Cryptosporangium arvum DSM 44712 TaxID=927661 RepID=A0A010YJS9_9ACTN|nr:CocE/NonD family hydrolase [Cryptosporangium arvum]EXG80500.1 putative hydrolase, CocE/NonD family [Cryptosporangium arvum DSM 44712]
MTPRLNLRVPGEDGTPLATDVYPAAAPAPVVVTRTAYGRSAHRAEGQAWAARGFAFVAQDVRGRHDSDGAWSPYRNERADGAALIDWVLRRPWCDGRLVTTGGSYAGYTAWAAAVTRPDAVRAVLSTGPAMGLDRVKFDPAGILRLAEHATWWLTRAESRTSREGLVTEVARRDPQWLHHLPVVGIAERMWARLEHWSDTITGGPGAEGPEAITDAELAAFPGAAFHVGGWYDLLLAETLRQWDVVGSAVSPRPGRQLLLGPWDHGFVWAPTTRIGGRDHGPDSRIPLGPRQVRWLREILGGARRSRADVFVVGAGWSSSPAWPPPTAPTVLWATGDDTLADTPPDTGSARTYVYDPKDPLPSSEPGADRAELEGRTDVVRWCGPALDQPMTLAGTPCVVLSASTDAPATDFVVRISERTTDGRVLPLASGAVDTSRSAGPAHRIPLTPIAVRIPAGSRLVLEVTSSDFPYLARSLNTGADRYTTTDTVAATQTIHAGPGGTRVELPEQVT